MSRFKINVLNLADLNLPKMTRIHRVRQLLFVIMLTFFSTQHGFSQCFQIESILVDACGPEEGYNEMVRFKVGPTAINTNNLDVDWPSNDWQGLVQNSVTAGKVATLNGDILDAGGCGQLIEPTGGILPANATVILVTSYKLDTALNSFGPLTNDIYIIFQDNAAASGGHFANYGSSALRTLDISFGSCSDSVTYNRSLLITPTGGNSAADGATVVFDPAGTATYINNGCSAPVQPFTIDAGPATLTACSGSTIALNGTAQGQSTVFWSAPSGTFSSPDTLSTNYTVSGAPGTTVILTLTNTNSCDATVADTILLTISNGTVPNFAQIAPFCSGTVAPVLNTTSPNGITGTWSPAVVSNTANGSYTFTPATGQCASPVTLNVIVNNSIVPDFATTLALCTGSTAPTLVTTSPNGVTGTWNPAVISNTTNGNYIFTPTNGQCASPITLTVTVSNSIVPDFPTTLLLCTGVTAPVLNTTSPNGITGTWNPAVISNTTNGNYVFTPTAGQCASPVTLTVTVGNNIIPNFPTTLALCTGAAAPVLNTTSPNGVTGTWSPTVVSNTTNGNYVFTPTAGQCAGPVTLAVTINNSITPNFAPIAAFCSGTTAPVLNTTSPNGVTGTWNPAVISNTTNGSYTFTPAAGQCASSVTLAVIVNPTITPDFPTTLAFCTGSTAPVLNTTSPNGITGTWNPAVISNTANGSYTFTPTAGQCSVPVTLVVTVSNSITPDFNTTLVLCSAATTVPVLNTTSPNGITGTWNPSIISNIPGSTYVFTPNAGQCAVSVTLTVTVAGSITPNFAPIAPFCSGTTAPVLNTTSPNGITGTWSPAVISNTANGSYTFTPAAGQCAVPVTLPVIVNTTITPDFPTTLAFCSGSTAPVLNATSPNGITGTWNPAVINNTTNGNYVFTPTAGQCAPAVTLVVTVNSITTPNFATTLTLCTAAPAPALNTTSPNGITGTWNPAVISNTANGSYTFTPTAGQCAVPVTLVVTVSGSITPDFDTALTLCSTAVAPALNTTSPNGITGTWNPATISTTVGGNYIFTPAAGQCAVPVTLAVTITNSIAPDFAPSITVCDGIAVIPALNTTSPNGITGTWSPDVLTTPGTYVFTPDAGQCASAFSLTFSFYNISFDLDQQCVAGNYMIQVVPTDSSFDPDTVNYEWKNENGNTVGSNEASLNVSELLNATTAVETFPINYTVTVRTHEGCEFTQPATVYGVFCTIPKGISPNGDNKNDELDLTGMGVKEIVIFNRYGTKVYSRRNYTKEWKGQSDDGHELPDATYFYVVSKDNGESVTGWIYVNK